MRTPRNRLRFALIRPVPSSGGPSNEGFVVSRVGPYRVPLGSFVSIYDPTVLASIPPKAVEQMSLEVQVSFNSDSTSYTLPAVAASFGPSIASTTPPASSFAFAQPSLPLVLATFPFGCEPHPTDDAVETSLEGKVVVLHRGRCGFAKKSNLAALGGAKAVIVVNSDDQADFVPSMEGEEEKYKALVPLVVVSNSTGAALEQMLLGLGGERGEAMVRPVRSREETVEHLILGGYTVTNVRLMRGGLQ